MFRFFIIPFLLTCSILVNAQDFKYLKISTGTTYANITSVRPAYEDINPFRYGFWISAGHNLKIKKRISLDVGATYQERIPLEFFEFSQNPQTNSGTFLSIRDYPSSPQHRFFKTGYFNYFPNFKYLHFEAIPSISFGKKVEFNIGIGLFSGILLNKNQTKKTAADFPELEAAFQQLDIQGTVEYTRFDFGIIPKINCFYNISEEIGIGLELKSYHSLVRMNDTLIESTRAFNLFWIAYSGGFCVRYGF